MGTSKTRNSRVFTISFPEPLAKQVEQTAKEESRNISELFREAWRTYRFHLYERKLMQLRPPVDQGPGAVTEDDIEGIVDEIRSQSYKLRQSKKKA